MYSKVRTAEKKNYAEIITAKLNMSDVASDVVPEVVNEVVSDTVPEVTSDVVPETATDSIADTDVACDVVPEESVSSKKTKTRRQNIENILI